MTKAYIVRAGRELAETCDRSVVDECLDLSIGRVSEAARASPVSEERSARAGSLSGYFRRGGLAPTGGRRAVDLNATTDAPRTDDDGHTTTRAAAGPAEANAVRLRRLCKQQFGRPHRRDGGAEYLAEIRSAEAMISANPSAAGEACRSQKYFARSANSLSGGSTGGPRHEACRPVPSRLDR